MKEIDPRDLDEYISTSHEANILIMHEINRNIRGNKTEVLLTGCALMLQSVGVDFSNMSYGNICKHCRGYEEHHDKNGKREECPGFELYVSEELQEWARQNPQAAEDLQSFAKRVMKQQSKTKVFDANGNELYETDEYSPRA